jgi:hypothetical protein
MPTAFMWICMMPTCAPPTPMCIPLRPVCAPSISTCMHTLDTHTHAGRLDTRPHAHPSTPMQDTRCLVATPLPHLKHGSEGTFSPMPTSSPGSPSPAQLHMHIRYVIATSKHVTFTDSFYTRHCYRGPHVCPSPLTLTPAPSMLTLTPSMLMLTLSMLMPTSRTVDDTHLTCMQDTYLHSDKLCLWYGER